MAICGDLSGDCQKPCVREPGDHEHVCIDGHHWNDTKNTLGCIGGVAVVLLLLLLGLIIYFAFPYVVDVIHRAGFWIGGIGMLITLAFLRPIRLLPVLIFVAFAVVLLWSVRQTAVSIASTSHVARDSCASLNRSNWKARYAQIDGVSLCVLTSQTAHAEFWSLIPSDLEFGGMPYSRTALTPDALRTEQRVLLIDEAQAEALIAQLKPISH